MSSRREFLRALAALGAAAAAPARAIAAPRFNRDPFGLGVASGYPSEGGAVLWTRLITDLERGDGGLDPVPIAVRWEVASDEAMRNVVASGVEAARPEWAHSVHVEVKEGETYTDSFRLNGRWALLAVSGWGALALIADWLLFGLAPLSYESGLQACVIVLPAVFLATEARRAREAITVVNLAVTLWAAWQFSPKFY